jgi:hypothetical protein
VTSDAAESVAKFVLLRKEAVPALPAVRAGADGASAWVGVALAYLGKMRAKGAPPRARRPLSVSPRPPGWFRRRARGAVVVSAPRKRVLLRAPAPPRPLAR